MKRNTQRNQHVYTLLFTPKYIQGGAPKIAKLAYNSNTVTMVYR
jgi:hypothetical protein